MTQPPFTPIPSSPATPAPAATAPFTTAHAVADHWGVAAKLCREQLGDAVKGANLGFLYATESFSGNLGSILTYLRETTRIEHWVGGVAPGICVGDREFREQGAIAAMVGHLDPDNFHVFAGDVGSWPEWRFPILGLVHGDPRDPGLPDAIEFVADVTGYLAGGLLSSLGPPAQLADQVMAGGLSGIMVDEAIPVLTGMTQGCSPVGGMHTITECLDGIIMRLDDKPALDVLKQEVGELLARDLRRIAGYIHVGLPVPGSDGPDYQVRTLMGVDPAQGWIAMGGQAAVGDQMIFVRRDANTAQADLKRMLDDIRRRLGNRPIRAGIYVSCTGRGVYMFGEAGAEPLALQEALGDFPLIGFFANGEICRDRLYGFTGVLTLFPGEAAS
jgi:small ligand-binding sensory domain FIST